jgi:hypothetical protein
VSPLSLRWLRRIALAIGVSCALGTVAHAMPVTYTLHMVASGSLGATHFANTKLTVTAIGDASDVTSIAPNVPCNGLWGTTFTISGVDSGSIVSPLGIAVNQGMQLVGLTRGSCGASDPLWVSGYSAEAGTYNLASGIGSTMLGSPSPQSGVYPSTSSGMLALKEITSMTFEATFGTSVVPTVGLWWNPSESGSGYNIDVKNGVLVATIFTYKANGDPQWYITSGPIVDNVFTGTINKYSGGQCISCPYKGLPVSSGNDGVIRIELTSPTSATLSLPGGRVTRIQPQAF